MLKKWTGYVRDLLNNNRIKQIEIAVKDNEILGILKEEIKADLKNSKNEEVLVGDHIQVESLYLKCF